MFKVIIIDDEAVIRKGLRNVINWGSLECEVVDEASDGVEGLEKIQKHSPNIIITDIKMPEMNGLDMIKKAKIFVPDCKIIVLTGHRDFDFVHEAIRLGAFDFVLKPTKIEELTEIIRRVVTQLKMQKMKDKEYEKFKTLFEKNLPLLCEKFFYDVLNGIITDRDTIFQKKELFKIDFDSYMLVLVDNENISIEQSQYDKQLHRFGIINTFNELFGGKYEVFNVNISDNQTCFIVNNSLQKDNFTDNVSKLCEDLLEIINNCFGFYATISISSAGEHVSELSEKYYQCKEALGRKIYMDDNSIIRYEDVKQFIYFSDYSVLEIAQKKLINNVKIGNINGVQVSLKEIKRYIRELSIDDTEYLKDFYFNSITSLNNVRKTLKIKVDKYESTNIGSLYDLISRSEDINVMNEILSNVANDICQKVNAFNTDSIRSSIKNALEYINENYSQQITLNEVADNVFLSTYYVSRLFKRELGKSFIDYLTELRIEKAKELLLSTEYKAYEIADLVGISDAHYFSKLFKKYVGMTPTQFKEKK